MRWNILVCSCKSCIEDIRLNGKVVLIYRLVNHRKHKLACIPHRCVLPGGSELWDLEYSACTDP